MTTSYPLPMRWEGDGFKPLNAFWAKRADQQFVIGQVYRMEEVNERSAASHAHYFAALGVAWKNLPEDIAEEYPSVECFRKKLLVKAGYYNERSIVCASAAEALRIAAFIRPINEYAIIVVRGASIMEFTAKSQSLKAMGKADFVASKTAVLEIAASMIGVSPDALRKEAAAA